jgi:SGNH domain (fused to AT3 domains)
MSAWCSSHDLIQDFYSPLTRFWELTIGALLAYWPYVKSYQNLIIRQGHAYSVIGGLILLIALYVIDQSKEFPGYWVALPVLASVFLLGAGSESVLNKRVLSHPWMVKLGIISYPLYLWHWPIFSMVRVVQGEQASVIERLLMVGVSVCFAWATYRWVEIPIRFQIKHAYKIWLLLFVMTCIGVLGYVTYKADGFPRRDVMGAERIFNQGDLGHDEFHQYFQEHFESCVESSISNTAGKWHGMVRCFQSQKSSLFDVVLVGDSHAEHLFIGLAEAMPDKNVVFYSKPGMPLMAEREFATVFDLVMQTNNYSTVVLAANWAPKIKKDSLHLFEKDLGDTVSKLLTAGKKVYVLSDVPQFAFDPQKCKYQRPLSGGVKCEMPRQEAELQLNKYWDVVKQTQKKYPSLQVIELTNLFCTSEICQMANQGVLLYRDNNHLNIRGSRYVGLDISNSL